MMNMTANGVTSFEENEQKPPIEVLKEWQDREMIGQKGILINSFQFTDFICFFCSKENRGLVQDQENTGLVFETEVIHQVWNQLQKGFDMTIMEATIITTIMEEVIINLNTGILNEKSISPVARHLRGCNPKIYDSIFLK